MSVCIKPNLFNIDKMFLSDEKEYSIEKEDNKYNFKKINILYKYDFNICKSLQILTNYIDVLKCFTKYDKIKIIISDPFIIDIYNMTDDIFKYSLYDVIYLPELIKKFINKGVIYKTIIPQVSCVINKYRRNIEDEFNKIERIINYLNIAFIYDNNNKVLLKDIWESYIYFITDKEKYLEHIMFMHYFKNFFEVITKMIIYNSISKLYPIYNLI